MTRADTIALVPAFNEAKRIAEVVARTQPHVATVVVIDDGSADATGEVAKQAGAVVLRHPVNRGKGAAIATALEHLAKSDAAAGVFLDADGQHDPSEIPHFIAAVNEQNAGVVVGTRMTNVQNMPLIRKWTNEFTSWLTSRLARQRIPDSQCGYRLIHRSVLPAVHLTSVRFEADTEMLIQAGRAGHRIVSIPIRTIYEGQASHIRPVRDALRFLRLLWKYW